MCIQCEMEEQIPDTALNIAAQSSALDEISSKAFRQTLGKRKRQQLSQAEERGSKKSLSQQLSQAEDRGSKKSLSQSNNFNKLFCD